MNKYNTDRKLRSCPIFGLAYAIYMQGQDTQGKKNLADDFLQCDGDCCALWSDERERCGLIAPNSGWGG